MPSRPTLPLRSPLPYTSQAVGLQYTQQFLITRADHKLLRKIASCVIPINSHDSQNKLIRNTLFFCQGALVTKVVQMDREAVCVFRKWNYMQPFGRLAAAPPVVVCSRFAFGAARTMTQSIGEQLRRVRSPWPMACECKNSCLFRQRRQFLLNDS